MKNRTRTKVIMPLVTNACNLNCTYCYENHKSHEMMTFDIAKDGILSEVNDERFEYFSIQFMGGEPLLNFPLIKKICEWIWKDNPISKPYELFISTNGTCLDDKMKLWFTQNKDRISMGLSFDGIPLVQNVNRSGSNGVIDTQFFLQNWPKSYFKMTISCYSIKYLCESIIYLEELGVQNIKADLAYMQGWTVEHLIEFEKQLDLLLQYYTLDKGHECHCSLFNLEIGSIFANKVKPKRCGCGETIVCIDFRGNKYPCQMFAPISMDSECFDKVKYLDFRNEINFTSEHCQDCILQAICPTCVGCNLKFNGSLTAKDPIYCKAFVIQFLKFVEYKYSKEQNCINNEENKTIKDLVKIVNALKIKEYYE